MSTDDFAPGVRVGSYEIDGLLGQGAMGSVWKAVHAGLRKTVAIKTLKPEYAGKANALSRFRREGEAASRIRHPNVVEINDMGEHHGVPYLVMEFLDGGDLQGYLRAKRRLSETEVADLMIPVCAALFVAHEAGVIHRDVKPANIFLLKARDGFLQPKVVDFGISRIEDDANHRTATSALLGTPRYMAPEQARGAKFVDARSDQYAVGVTMYEAATGVPPIDEAVLYEQLRRVVHADYLRPREHRAELSEAFEGVILRAMMLDPAKRFSSIRELGEALLPFASERTRVLHASTLASTTTTIEESPSPYREAVASTVQSEGPARPIETLPAAAPRLDTLSSISETAREVGAREGLRRARRPLLVLAAAGLASAALVFAVGLATRDAPRPVAASAASVPPIVAAAQPLVAPSVQSPSAPTSDVRPPGPVPAEVSDVVAAEPVRRARSRPMGRRGAESRRPARVPSHTVTGPSRPGDPSASGGDGLVTTGGVVVR